MRRFFAYQKVADPLSLFGTADRLYEFLAVKPLRNVRKIYKLFKLLFIFVAYKSVSDKIKKLFCRMYLYGHRHHIFRELYCLKPVLAYIYGYAYVIYFAYSLYGFDTVVKLRAVLYLKAHSDNAYKHTKRRINRQRKNYRIQARLYYRAFGIENTYIVFIIEAKYPVITCSLSQSVGIMQN